MSWFTALITYAITTLTALVAGTAAYAIWLRMRIHKLAKMVPTAQLNTTSLVGNEPPIMRYSEYKHRYGSRTRDVAIITSAKLPSTVAVVNEFIETMREHGTLLYHFTHYWGNSSAKTNQRQLADALNGKHHAVYVLGRTAIRVARHAAISGKNLFPTVFSNVRDSWWQEEQTKKPVNHMTGVTGSSGWRKRIKLFVAIKPTMLSALIPVPSGPGSLQSDIDEIARLLQSYGVTPHIVKVHDGPELLAAITHYAPKIDTIIGIPHHLLSTFTHQIATVCTNHNLTFFSTYHADVYSGAAAAVSCSNMKIGWHAAYKMIALLEEHKSPIDIPISNIGFDHPYVAHFNQVTMKAQGIDPETIVPLALRYGSLVHIAVEEDK